MPTLLKPAEGAPRTKTPMHSRDPVFASLHRLMAFAQALQVYRMVVEVAREPKQTFWNMTINLLFDTAAVEWSKVFGS